MQKKIHATTKKPDALDTETIRRILIETARDIAPASPALFSRIEQNIEESTSGRGTGKAVFPSFLQALAARLRDYFNRPQLAWGVVAAQTIVLCLFLLFSPVQENSYQTLSTNQPDTGSIQSFQVIFDTGAGIHEMEQLLRKAGAIIVNGPGPGGVYTIQLHRPQLGPSAKNNTLLMLKQSPLVTFLGKTY